MNKSGYLFILVVFIYLMGCSPKTGLVQQSRGYNFIEKENIQWASAVYENIKFPQNSLPGILLNEFEKRSLNVYHALGTDTLRKVSNEQLSAYYETLTTFPLLDNKGKISQEYYNAAGSPIRFDSASANFVYAYLVVYVENGQPKIFVRNVSPKISFYTPGNRMIGTGELFSTMPGIKPGKKKSSSLEYAGRTESRYPADTALLKGNLKRLYNEGLLENLWPSVLSGKHELSLNRSGSETKLTSITGRDSVNVPLYDEAGKYSGASMVRAPLTPASADFADLVIDWYFDRRNDRIYAELSELKIAFKDHQNDLYFLRILFQK